MAGTVRQLMEDSAVILRCVDELLAHGEDNFISSRSIESTVAFLVGEFHAFAAQVVLSIPTLLWGGFFTSLIRKRNSPLLHKFISYDILLNESSLYSEWKGVILTEKSYSPSSKASLRKGEQQRPNGTFAFRWTDAYGQRHTVYAETLADLRQKEENIDHDLRDHIKPEARSVTLNDMFDLWQRLKRGLKDNTFQNYVYMYRQYVAPRFGRKRIASLVKSDVKHFYNTLVDERGLSIATVDIVHNVVHQVFDMAVEDSYIRRNPADNALKELKKELALYRGKRRSLTKAEQELFLTYLRHSEQYQHWYPVFAVLIGTGLRVGEAVGLRWCDIDLEQGIIDVNHTLVYYRHAVDGCYCNIHTPKTVNGIRQVPMLSFVKKAFLEERQRQHCEGIQCNADINGYTDFIFLNRNGQPQHQGTLNKALRRITRDCNTEAMARGNKVLLPHFSCHSLRHTFATRMCEAGINVKVIQDTLGHADVSTTLNIYADATKELKQTEFYHLDDLWSKA